MSEVFISSIKFICRHPETFITDMELIQTISDSITICVSEEEIIIIAIRGSSNICVFKYIPGDVLDWIKDDVKLDEHGAFVISLSINDVIKVLKSLKKKIGKKPRDLVGEVKSNGGFTFIDIDKDKDNNQKRVSSSSNIKNDTNPTEEITLNTYYAIEDILSNENYLITIPFNIDLIDNDLENAINFSNDIILGYNNRECSLTIESIGIKGEFKSSILLKDFGEVDIGDVRPFSTPFTEKSIKTLREFGKKFNILKFGDTVPLALMSTSVVNDIIVNRAWLLISPIESSSYD